MSEDLYIRQATVSDAQGCSDIYNWYVLHSLATFETVAVDAESMRQRIEEKLRLHDWLVGEMDGQIAGYAYFGSFRPRAAYRHTVESTIYLSQNAQGKGFGKILYSALIESAAAKGFREMIGVIALPNRSSVALHERLGFREAGVLRSVGHKCDRFIDVALWQKALGVSILQAA